MNLYFYSPIQQPDSIETLMNYSNNLSENANFCGNLKSFQILHLKMLKTVIIMIHFSWLFTEFFREHFNTNITFHPENKKKFDWGL